jgi:uncharacterized membrane protein (Fun14 family)
MKMSMNIPSWVPPLVASGGVGTGAGYLIGYALKKFLKIFLKIIAVVLGLIMTAVMLVISWLEASAIITITVTFNSAKLENVLESALTWGVGQVGTFVSAVSAAANASVGTISLVGGLVLGFKKG